MELYYALIGQVAKPFIDFVCFTLHAIGDRLP